MRHGNAALASRLPDNPGGDMPKSVTRKYISSRCPRRRRRQSGDQGITTTAIAALRKICSRSAGRSLQRRHTILQAENNRSRPVHCPSANNTIKRQKLVTITSPLREEPPRRSTTRETGRLELFRNRRTRQPSGHVPRTLPMSTAAHLESGQRRHNCRELPGPEIEKNRIRQRSSSQWPAHAATGDRSRRNLLREVMKHRGKT